MTQVNMIALPRDWAFDFLLYAQRNPQSCPVLDVLEAGQCHTMLAAGGRVDTDIPRYRVWRDGELAKEVTDAREIWQSHPTGSLFDWLQLHIRNTTDAGRH